MPSPVDLHSHSNASDGELSPAELVQRARQRGVSLLALTDHDTTAGIAAAQQAAHAGPTPGLEPIPGHVLADHLRLIPGVEISVTWHSQVIHVLGLNINPDSARLQAGLQGLSVQRELRAQQIAKQLTQKGVKDAYAGAKALAVGPLTRTHFAHYLVQQGLANNLQTVFKHYLVRGKPGYVAGQWATLNEALSWIHDAGGQAVVAHPARYKMTRSKLKELLAEFKAGGGCGLEVVSGTHSRNDTVQMAELARLFGLYSSAGSDYHGPKQFWLHLGAIPPLPKDCEAIWQLFV